ncbi:N6-Methyl-AMP deaminase isoform X4 [Urocitellus parryii]|uniref:N6-Methyl-AMP deaminase n=1 Tax=Urocitellus parryii TaxID=9999 RepID=A0A8D2HQU5_UROPR|nr:adenosine deaminase-like protein isoform X4 [Urocitellus parryii]
MEVKHSEENLGPQNLFAEIQCIIQIKNKSGEELFIFPAKIMEVEEQQQPWKTSFYTELPKVELHAHLNGSISSNTMRKLIAKKPNLKIHDHMTMIDKGKKRTLEEYLMAIDRRGGPSVAKETVKLAEEFFLSTEDTVLGLDLSGDPTIGQAKDFLEPLLEAKKAGLKLALHLSEIPNQNKETQMLLDLLPDRIGHGTFLNSSEEGSLNLVDFVRQHQIPLELCLTSNIKSQTVPSYDQHHFGFWYSIAHPSVICTDDKGVFATYLSQEYQLAAETFNLTKSQVWDLSYESISYIFASDSTRSELRKKWKNLKPKVLHF